MKNICRVESVPYIFMYEEKWFYRRYFQIIFCTQWARLGHRVISEGQTDKQNPTVEASFREGPVESVFGVMSLMPLDQRGLEKLRHSVPESVTLQ